MDDPDMGLTNFTFNAFGEQTSQTDAKSKTITLKYDKLGRMVERQVPSINNGIDLSTFVYDSAANGIGAIASLSGPNGSATSYAYDPFGRADSTTTTIRGQSFNQSYTYNGDGFLATQRYPDSGAGNEFSVKYNYLNGYLSSITGVENQQGLCVEHWRAEEYDAAGRIKQDTLGTLVSTTRTYDQAQGVLQRIESILQVNNQATVQDLNYTYDANNNLTTRSDAMTSVSESFEYDVLDRLRFHHKGSDTTEVRYDAIGNITYKSDVGSYSYGANGAGPHALTRVELPLGTDPLMSFEVNWKWNGQDYLKTLPNIHGQTFQYDGNGNVNISGDRRVWWTAFDKPYRMERVDAGLNITSGSDFEYDATFNRIVKEQDDGQTTIYLGKDYEKITEHNGDIKHRYTISTGGSTIQIERDNNSDIDQPKYLLGDNLGSTNVILDAAGIVQQRQAFDPWGMRLNIGDPTAVNSITNKGYTGHEMDDEVGLTNMNARIYDPYLGRFLSADPVLPDAYDMQSFNRYSYVVNNPLKYTDPTGHVAGTVGGYTDVGNQPNSCSYGAGCIRDTGSGGIGVSGGGSGGEAARAHANALNSTIGIPYGAQQSEAIQHYFQIGPEATYEELVDIGRSKEEAQDFVDRLFYPTGNPNNTPDVVIAPNPDTQYRNEGGEVVLNDDGNITASEARYNIQGPQIPLTQDLTTLDGVIGTDVAGDPFLRVGGNVSRSDEVHGRIPLIVNADGTLSANNGLGTRYDFNYDSNGGGVRNFETYVGGVVNGVGGYSSRGFDINYYGSIPDTRRPPDQSRSGGG